MNTYPTKKQKMIFKNVFLKLMCNAFSAKTIKIVRKHRDIELATAERRRKFMVLEPNYYTAKFFLKQNQKSLRINLSI